mmetsp:Transcript_15442/g.29135  ORF Transcript_15442/g.29135 Transcript_15442/m.29135 type:complete len:259 (+) Transcript_15442:166-942(+)
MPYTLPRTKSKLAFGVAAFLVFYSLIVQASLDSCLGFGSTMTLSYKLVEESPGEFKRFGAFHGDDPISVDTWIESLSIPSQIEKLVHVIKEASTDYPAFFFETKGVSPKTLTKHFEFVLVKSKQLERFVQDRGHDFDVFANYVNGEKSGASGSIDVSSSVSFFNLGGTSKLIAPKAVQQSRYIYSHFGMFLRNAPDQEIVEFWRLVGKEYRKSLDESMMTGGSKSLWLSTSGTGVAWLHMRIDDRPKYYTFGRFADEK